MLQKTLPPRVESKTKRIFLSHATEDRYFVKLLGKLLRVHGHEPFFTPEGISAGDDFTDAIESAIESADLLFVLVSPHAVDSRWVTREVASFEAVHPGRSIVPIVLERTKLAAICPGLEKYQAFDFSECLLSGFEELFAALGSDFLSPEELRNRRSGRDRRARKFDGVDGDRRVQSALQRLQNGFYLRYVRDTSRCALDEPDASPAGRATLHSILKAESRRYRFLDKATGRECESGPVILQSLDGVLSNLPPHVTVMAVFKSVAEDLFQAFDVRMVDRRRRRRRS